MSYDFTFLNINYKTAQINLCPWFFVFISVHFDILLFISDYNVNILTNKTKHKPQNLWVLIKSYGTRINIYFYEQKLTKIWITIIIFYQKCFFFFFNINISTICFIFTSTYCIIKKYF